MLRLADLREILRYVPQYREKTFVIALDGAVVAHENFRNILLDITLLRSLRIEVALVHGAGHQLHALAEQMGQTPSNIDGTGITDPATLQLAITAANRVTHEILEGLSATDLRGALSNALVAHPAGILHGVDHQLTGRVERVDLLLLRSLLEHDIIPVVAPLGSDGEGHTYRLNSDAVAVEVAQTLQAVKLIYLSSAEGIVVSRGPGQNPELLRQLKVEEADEVLKKHKELAQPTASKLAQAIRAARGGVPRVHIIDGRVEEGLLAEVFSNEGVGTLVHTNEYQAIRQAQKRDVRGIFALIQKGMETDELLQRSRGDIERLIDDFFVFEVDRNAAGCVALHYYPDTKKAEMACVCVDPKYENQGIGARLMQFAEAQARANGVTELFCLSTQAFNYFVQKGGFRLGTPDDLPPARRERYDRSGRRSQVLAKKL
jgi:amino-acid N-acetyltransferase